MTKTTNFGQRLLVIILSLIMAGGCLLAYLPQLAQTYAEDGEPVSDSSLPETVTPTEAPAETPTEEGASGTTTFYYTGTANDFADLWFYVSYAVSTDTSATAGSLADFGITSAVGSYNGSPAIVLTGDTAKLSSVWVDFGFGSKIGSSAVPFNGGAVEIADAAAYGETHFIYVGEAEGKTSADLWFWVSYIQSNTVEATSGSLADFGITQSVGSAGGYSRMTLKGNITDIYNTYVNVGVDAQIGGTSVSFDGTTYYVYDNAITTSPPSVPTKDYSLTVNCYGSGYQIGAWLARVENGTEVAWSPSAEAKTAAFAGDGDWTSATLTWTYPDDYNRLSFNIGQASPWESGTYNCDFSGLTGACWVIPGDASLYGSLEAAEEALNDGITTTTVIIHYKRDGRIHGWSVGTWFTTEIDGSWGEKNAIFTYKDAWGYVAIIEYDVKVPEIGFAIHLDQVQEGIYRTWVRTDTAAAGTVKVNRGFAEVWVVADVGDLTDECPEDALLFNSDLAEKFRVERYLYLLDPKGIDAKVNFHYYRAKQDYASWQIGVWGERPSGAWNEGNVALDTGKLDEHGAAVGELDLSDWAVRTIGFMPHYDSWSVMDGESKSIDVSKLQAGDVLDVYIYEGRSEVYLEPQPQIIDELNG